QSVETVNGLGGIWHCQFVRCTTAVVAADVNIDLHNVLFSKCGTAVSDSYGSDILRAEHVTADQVGTLFSTPYSNGGTLTNGILTAVTNIGVTLYNSTTNSSAAGIFQTVGGAAYYLDSDTNRNSGSPNISAALLADIRKKTTYPPLVYSNATLSADTTFGPQAQRDTDELDRGY